jgi:putative lipoic acid-binding regulatory protein
VDESPDDSPFEFPCDHDIKVMGRNSPEFRARMRAVLVAELGSGAADRATEKASGNGVFVSLTFTVLAHSRAELDRVYRALHATGLVLFAL